MQPRKAKSVPLSELAKCLDSIRTSNIVIKNGAEKHFKTLLGFKDKITINQINYAIRNATDREKRFFERFTKLMQQAGIVEK